MMSLEIIDLIPISYELDALYGFPEHPGNGSLYRWVKAFGHNLVA
jgi:hypothetical protein